MRISEIIVRCPTCGAHLRWVEGIRVSALARLEREAGNRVSGSWNWWQRGCWYWSLGRRRVYLEGRGTTQRPYPSACPGCGTRIYWWEDLEEIVATG